MSAMCSSTIVCRCASARAKGSARGQCAGNMCSFWPVAGVVLDFLMTDAADAESFLPKVISMIDRLAKKNTWHPNKAANLKSKLMKHVNQLKQA